MSVMAACLPVLMTIKPQNRGELRFPNVSHSCIMRETCFLDNGTSLDRHPAVVRVICDSR